MNPIRTWLLTGENNHDWRRTAPFFKDLLEEAGCFQVTVHEDSPAALADRAALSAVDLLFLDYNRSRWGERAERHFAEAVHAGARVVVFHAADNAFPGWIAYETMVGLLWREQTSHSKFHEFEVNIQDADHPVTRGLGDFKTCDELYHRLEPMHGTPVHILADAWSDPEQGGTGNREPVMMVSRYGRGRVFHHALGHVYPDKSGNQAPHTTLMAVENPGFRQTLRRGCEWAATGDVIHTQRTTRNNRSATQ